MKGQRQMDEFSLILVAVFIFMGILMVTWTTPTEFPPKAAPSSVSLSLQNGLSSSFDLNVSGKITNVTLSSSGQVANWIKFGKNNFDVIFGSIIVPISISVPKSATSGTYRGSISVSSTGGKISVPVTVDVTQISKIASRSINVGDFVVSYVSGSSVIESRESMFVAKGYFYRKDFDMAAAVDEKDISILTAAELRLVVGDTNSYGSMIVVFNDQEIFNDKVAAGETSIPIDKSLVRKSNTIKIKAGDPGFFFWANTVYNINILKFSVNRQGSFSKDLAFNLEPEEAANFDHAQLTFRVRDYSTPLPELGIAVNGQKIFSATPELGFFNRNFMTDISGNRIKFSTSNNISFAFNKQAFYDVSNAVLTIFYGV